MILTNFNKEFELLYWSSNTKEKKWNIQCIYTEFFSVKDFSWLQIFQDKIYFLKRTKVKKSNLWLDSFVCWGEMRKCVKGKKGMELNQVYKKNQIYKETGNYRTKWKNIVCVQYCINSLRHLFKYIKTKKACSEFHQSWKLDVLVNWSEEIRETVSLLLKSLFIIKLNEMVF